MGAKNLGAAVAHGEWLLFNDLDTLIPPEHMRRLVDFAAGRGGLAELTGGVCGLSCARGGLSPVALATHAIWGGSTKQTPRADSACGEQTWSASLWGGGKAARHLATACHAATQPPRSSPPPPHPTHPLSTPPTYPPPTFYAPHLHTRHHPKA